jgi:hypothetical protein
MSQMKTVGIIMGSGQFPFMVFYKGYGLILKSSYEHNLV